MPQEIPGYVIKIYIFLYFFSPRKDSIKRLLWEIWEIMRKHLSGISFLIKLDPVDLAKL